jgi:hypothetical protein
MSGNKMWIVTAVENGLLPAIRYQACGTDFHAMYNQAIDALVSYYESCETLTPEECKQKRKRYSDYKEDIKHGGYIDDGSYVSQIYVKLCVLQIDAVVKNVDRFREVGAEEATEAAPVKKRK